MAPAAMSRSDDPLSKLYREVGILALAATAYREVTTAQDNANEAGAAVGIPALTCSRRAISISPAPRRDKKRAGENFNILPVDSRNLSVPDEPGAARHGLPQTFRQATPLCPSRYRRSTLVQSSHGMLSNLWGLHGRGSAHMWIAGASKRADLLIVKMRVFTR
jgi:hypothetical protein